MQTFKSKSLKKISAIAAAVIGIVSFQSAQATPLNASGRVNNLVASDSSPATNKNSLTLVGVASLGNCPGVFGFVLFVFKDDVRGQQMYATALAAAASGSSVFISADDTIRDSNGFCYVTGFGIVGN